jgi:excisionase family DNA binding protein
MPHRPSAETGAHFHTPQAAAELLGITERTLRRMIASGDLPAYRLGPRLVRIKDSDLMAMLRPIPTADAS